MAPGPSTAHRSWFTSPTGLGGPNNRLQRGRLTTAAIGTPSLDGGGFIHCSTVDQFLIPANERFRGRGDLILLIVATGRLSAPLVYEDCYESGHRFPHVYGPIDLDAIVDVVDLPCRLDGCFDRPPDIEVRLSRLSDELC